MRRERPDDPLSEGNIGHILLVTGSRSIKDAGLVHGKLDRIEPRPTELIHGGAVGVDTLAGAWAKKHDIPVTVVRPDFRRWPVAKHRWKAYGMRDREMVDMATYVVAIWDGKSSGTRLTMEYAADQNKLHHVARR